MGLHYYANICCEETCNRCERNDHLFIVCILALIRPLQRRLHVTRGTLPGDRHVLLLLYPQWKNGLLIGVTLRGAVMKFNHDSDLSDFRRETI